jgi:hypothetical protein
MVRILHFIAAFLISFYTYGQSRSIRDFHEKYRDSGTYFSIRIDGGILKCLSNFETNDEDTKELMEVVNKIEAIDIHAIGRDDPGLEVDDIQKLKKNIKRDKYEELMIVKGDDGNVDFLIKEANGKVSDLLLIVDGKEEFLVMNINGDIDLKHISALGRKMDMKGMEHLEKIDED